MNTGQTLGMKTLCPFQLISALTWGAGLCLLKTFLVNQSEKNALKIHLNQDFFGPEHHKLKYGIKIKPLLHCCFSIRGDIALPTGRAISLRIEKQQCNNVLILYIGKKAGILASWNLYIGILLCEISILIQEFCYIVILKLVYWYVDWFSRYIGFFKFGILVYQTPWSRTLTLMHHVTPIE